MTEDQKVEEGKKMFSIFAARMFEQRVLQAYREQVGQERWLQLSRELEDEVEVKEEAKEQSQDQKKDETKLVQIIPPLTGAHLIASTGSKSRPRRAVRIPEWPPRM